MNPIFAIDPGPTQSAWLILNDNGIPFHWGIEDNETLIEALRGHAGHDLLVIEMIASYGMPVGAEVFETCTWIGRFEEAWPLPGSARLYRKDVSRALCNSPRANDATVRQALIDRFGPGKEKAIGRKGAKGPLYGITSDVWSALAVACVYYDGLVAAE